METSFDSTRPPNIPVGIDGMDYIIIIIIIIPAKMRYPAEFPPQSEDAAVVVVCSCLFVRA